MGHKVGLKGQIVIAKEHRERLGVGPGWETIQRVVDGHLEIHFLEPEHRRSLAGSLAKYVTRPISDDELHEARARAWVDVEEEQEITGQ